MYVKYAELFHLPRVCMRASSTPLDAAVVAAPMRKLCPAYKELSMPAKLSRYRSLEVNLLLVKGLLSLK